ncbi:unnamed protein product [Ectocarpus sp. 8 AP-2014]
MCRFSRQTAAAGRARALKSGRASCLLLLCRSLYDLIFFVYDTNLHVFFPWYAYRSKSTSCWLHGARAARRGAYSCTASFGDSGAQADLLPSPAMPMPMKIICGCLGYLR